jgi:cysteinyl-tRNA synthetase
MDLSWQSISAAHETIKRWRNKIASWGVPQIVSSDSLILSFLENDLDTPRVLTYLRALEKDVDVTNEQKSGSFVYADKVLGLDLTRAPEVRELSEDLKLILAQREAARLAKNWALSDQLRATLEAAGLEISDSASDQNWSWR